MKKTIKRFLVIVLVAVLCFGIKIPMAHAEDSLTVSLEVVYGQSEARSMLAMVNSFRTGNDAWAWNSSNTTQVQYDNLNELVYDYELEKAAMQRAAEIAISFSHTRPNGTSCFTAVTSGYGAKGENIAAGSTTAADAFRLWQETDADYAGQGHRRNMLSSGYNRIGIGHVVYQGVHYWVQELGYSTGETAVTSANDATTTVPLVIAPSQITAKSVVSSTTEINMIVGETVPVPTVTGQLSLPEAWPSSAKTVLVDYVWNIEDTSIISISDDVLKANNVGTTTMTTTVWGETVTIPVTVQEELPPTTHPGEWKQDRAGWWYSYDSGGYAVRCWELINGEWYHFNGNGYMQTGWIQDGAIWYYLMPSGAMATGWRNIGGTWYYLEESGAMVTGWKNVDDTWYYFEGSGAMVTGWKNVGGTWYYLEGSGAMATGWKNVGGTWYYLEDNGAMATDWKNVGGTWYYLNTDGAMQTGWLQDGTVWYYLNRSGEMEHDTTIDGYVLDSNGAWIR